MKVKILFIVCCMFCCCGCYHNPPERNRIVFIDSYSNVQDSLLKMKSLLPRLTKRADSLNTNYSIKDGMLLINDTLQKNNIIEANKSTFTDEEKVEFVKLAFFLNKNFISCAYTGYSAGAWYFEYRQKKNTDFNDSRNITVLDNKDLVSSLDSVIDQKDKMYLVVGKSATIR